jgi:hypothetical protein
VFRNILSRIGGAPLTPPETAASVLSVINAIRRRHVDLMRVHAAICC